MTLESHIVGWPVSHVMALSPRWPLQEPDTRGQEEKYGIVSAASNCYHSNFYHISEFEFIIFLLELFDLKLKS